MCLFITVAAWRQCIWL